MCVPRLSIELMITQEKIMNHGVSSAGKDLPGRLGIEGTVLTASSVFFSFGLLMLRHTGEIIATEVRV